MPTPIPGWSHSRMPDPISGYPTHLRMPTPILEWPHPGRTESIPEWEAFQNGRTHCSKKCILQWVRPMIEWSYSRMPNPLQ